MTCSAEGKEDDKLIRDVIGFVKGGTTGPSAAQLVVHNAEAYRAWGKSLKHNPVVIRFEVHHPTASTQFFLTQHFFLSLIYMLTIYITFVFTNHKRLQTSHSSL